MTGLLKNAGFLSNRICTALLAFMFLTANAEAFPVPGKPNKVAPSPISATERLTNYLSKEDFSDTKTFTELRAHVFERDSVSWGVLIKKTAKKLPPKKRSELLRQLLATDPNLFWELSQNSIIEFSKLYPDEIRTAIKGAHENKDYFLLFLYSEAYTKRRFSNPKFAIQTEIDLSEITGTKAKFLKNPDDQMWFSLADRSVAWNNTARSKALYRFLAHQPSIFRLLTPKEMASSIERDLWTLNEYVAELNQELESIFEEHTDWYSPPFQSKELQKLKNRHGHGIINLSIELKRRVKNEKDYGLSNPGREKFAKWAQKFESAKRDLENIRKALNSDWMKAVRDPLYHARFTTLLVRAQLKLDRNWQTALDAFDSFPKDSIDEPTFRRIALEEFGPLIREIVQAAAAENLERQELKAKFGVFIEDHYEPKILERMNEKEFCKNSSDIAWSVLAKKEMDAVLQNADQKGTIDAQMNLVHSRISKFIERLATQAKKNPEEVRKILGTIDSAEPYLSKGKP